MSLSSSRITKLQLLLLFIQERIRVFPSHTQTHTLSRPKPFIQNANHSSRDLDPARGILDRWSSPHHVKHHRIGGNRCAIFRNDVRSGIWLNYITRIEKARGEFTHEWGKKTRIHFTVNHRRQ